MSSRSRRRRPRPLPCRDNDSTGRGSIGGFTEPLEKDPSLSACAQIDTILEKRQKDGPPRPQGADARAASGAVSRSNVDVEGIGSVLVEDGVETPRTLARRHKQPMSNQEIAEAHADVFGRLPPDAARTEEGMIALEIEVEKLPEAERHALTDAMRKHPLLFVNCPHTIMMLEQDEDDFDAASTARRLAKYWECRRSLFGDGECYAPGVFAKPVFADYRRYYERTLAILDDPRIDEMAREDAERLLKIIHKSKIEALDEVLEEMEEASKESFNLDEHDDAVVAEASLESSARTMSKESPNELKLKFLSVENMNEVKAARRLVWYWKMGLDLFGPDIMCDKRVALDDIEDCSELFRCNQIRLMPEEDKFGRSIIVWRQIISPDGDKHSSDLMSEERMDHFGINEDDYAKIVWYTLHFALERESCQRNGYVLICDFRATDDNFKKRGPHRQAIMNVSSCVPVKLRAVHFLFGPDFPWWRRQVIRGITYLMRISQQRRFVVHGGTMDENLARLGGDFGIEAEKLPSDLGGVVEAEYFARLLEERRAAGL